MKRTGGVGHVPNEKHILICTAEFTLEGEKASTSMLKRAIDYRKTLSSLKVDSRPIGMATLRRLGLSLAEQELIVREFGLIALSEGSNQPATAGWLYEATESGLLAASRYYIEEVIAGCKTGEFYDTLANTNLGRFALEQANPDL